jgi:hypothetical protein
MFSENTKPAFRISSELAFGLCTAMALLAIIVSIGAELLQSGA